MIFAFVVKRLRWLARVPSFPQLFDAMLLICTGLFHRERLEAMEEFEQAALALPRVETRPHRFGGVGFFVERHELCHLHGNGLFDAFVGRANREELVNTGRALGHHVFPASGWVSFWIETHAEVARALDLMRVAQSYQLQSQSRVT